MEQAVTAKTTRIIVETETRLVIRRAKTDLAWCPECCAQVDVISLDSQTLLDPVTAARIQEWLGGGTLHSWRCADGPTQICLESLFRCFQSDGVQSLFLSHQKPFDPSRRK